MWEKKTAFAIQKQLWDLVPLWEKHCNIDVVHSSERPYATPTFYVKSAGDR